MVSILNSFRMVKVVLIVLSVIIPVNLALITRSEWEALSPKFTRRFTGKIPYIIIHHSVTPTCTTADACKKAMRSMQKGHMSGKGWSDIGYSFAVGGDGEIYEGRGWNVIGAHAPDYNSKSIGIVFIGDYRTSTPTAQMISAAKNFIADGIAAEKFTPNYKLIGHRQTKQTECPGQLLYDEIKSWPQWASKV